MTILTITCRIFLRAWVIYALITLPSLFWDDIYIISLLFGLPLSLISFCVFISVFYVLKKIRTSHGYIILYLITPVAVAVALQAIDLKFAVGIWNNYIVLLYPSAAVIAGWIGLYLCRKEINEQFNFQQYA